MREEYEAMYGTRYLPPSYPCSIIQNIIDNWGVAAYTIDIRSGSVFPWLSGGHNEAATTKRYLQSAHPGLGYNLWRTLKDGTVLVDSSYELGVELIYAYYHLVGDNGDRIQEAHDADARNMAYYDQYLLKYASAVAECRTKHHRRRQRPRR
jgi:hypothetical protein